jgi:cytochrome P450
MKRLLLRLLTALFTPARQVALARLVLRFGPRSVRLGNTLLLYRWQDVRDALHRDEDFLIAPVNRERIVAVSGPFILGMDRSPELFQQRTCVYNAMHDADFGLIDKGLAAGIADCLQQARKAGGKLDVVNGYARRVAGQTACAYFGVSGPDEASTLRVMRAIFYETFLNVANDPDVRSAGIAAGGELSVWIRTAIDRRRKSGSLEHDVLSRLLHHAVPLGLDDEAVRWMLSGLIVGAVDTTATVTANIVKEIVDDRQLLASMQRDLGNQAALRGWCWEALRRRPHNALILRSAGSSGQVAERAVKPGTRVYAVTIAAMQDPAAFPDPKLLRPDRPDHVYMHFGHGLHECAGRQINAVQVPALVAALVAEGVSGAAGIRFDGPFPDTLMVKLGGASP